MGNYKVVKAGLKSLAIIVLSLSIAAEMPLIVRAELTSDKIKKSQEEKDKAQKDKSALESGLSDVKSSITGLEQAKSNLENSIEELDKELEAVNSKISETEKDIIAKTVDVNDATKKLDAAIVVKDNQFEAMKKRVKYMYERGGSGSYLQMLVESRSLVDLLNRAEFISKIEEYDNKMLREYKASCELIEKEKDALIAEEKELEEAKSQLLSQQSEMEDVIKKKEEEVAKYESDIANSEEAVRVYEQEIAEQTQLIKDLEATIAAEKKRLEESNKSKIKYDGGKFAWPAPSYTRISDDYGWRTHPILNVKQYHNGIDIASPSGSPVLAAYNGEVVTASYTAAMGNYIMIDHGDDLYTLYLHLSSIGVSKGETVSRGQQIGKVGSTGRSTGPHLHFTVRKNGEYDSPWNYISK